MADGGPRPGLHSLVAEGRGGILLFGITPPKSSTAPADRARIAERTLERLGHLDLDGLILYDIDDESDRIAEDRPFPYLPTSDPAAFYSEHLGGWTRPVVVYRSIGKYAPDRAQRLARRVGPEPRAGGLRRCHLQSARTCGRVSPRLIGCGVPCDLRWPSAG